MQSHQPPEKYPLDAARDLAARLMEMMAPCVERIAIAGSIRREKPAVKDLELVCIPKWSPRADDLFGFPMRDAPLKRSETEENLLYQWAVQQDTIQWIKAGKNPDIVRAPDPDGLYWRAQVPGHDVWDPVAGAARPVKLDLFIARPESWGKIFLMRTGAAAFSAAVFAQAKRAGFPQLERIPYAGEVLEEREVFEACRLAWVEPKDRSANIIEEAYAIVNKAARTYKPKEVKL